MLPREPNRNDHRLVVYKTDIRLREVQGCRGCGRGLHRFRESLCLRDHSGRRVRKLVRCSDPQQELWPRGYQVSSDRASRLSGDHGVARLGIAIAHPALIHVLNNAKAPYNISTPTAFLALRALSPESLHLKQNKVAVLSASRVKLLQSLSTIPAIGAPIGANEANFVMVPVLDRNGNKDTDRALAAYKTMAEEKGVVVRFRGKELGCEACLRITIGTEEENDKVVEKLKEVLVD